MLFLARELGYSLRLNVLLGLRNYFVHCFSGEDACGEIVA